jgi:hypothetical protein
LALGSHVSVSGPLFISVSFDIEPGPSFGRTPYSSE